MGAQMSRHAPADLRRLSDQERLAWAEFALPFAEAHRDVCRDSRASPFHLANAQSLVDQVAFIIQSEGRMPRGAA